MQIFFWAKVAVLAQHADGQVIAAAGSKEEAVALAVAAYEADEHAVYVRTTYEAYSSKALEAELLAAEPAVFDAPKAFVVFGSA